MKWQQRRKIVTASGLTASEKAVLAAHLHFAPILLDSRGAFFWGPSVVALSLLVKATGKSLATVKRVRAGLIRRNLLAPVGLRQFEGNKSMTEFVMNNAEIRAMYYQCEDPTLDAQIEKALEELRKPDPFRGLHKKAKPLYLALSKKPDMTNAALAKKLGVDARTVKRVKANLVEAGAMFPATEPGSGPKLNPNYFRPPSVEVLEDFEPIEGVTKPGSRGWSEPRQSPAHKGVTKGGQIPGHAQQNKGFEEGGKRGSFPGPQGVTKGGQTPAHFEPLIYNTSPDADHELSGHQTGTVSGQPENSLSEFSPLDAGDQSGAGAQADQSGSDLDGRADDVPSWEEYQRAHAMLGWSLFTLRAKARKAGVVVPPLTLSGGSALEADSTASNEPFTEVTLESWGERHGA